MAIVGILLLAVGLSQADERGAAAGTGNALQVLTQSKLEVGDVPGHELAQAIVDEEIKTPDRIAGVSFDGAKVKALRQSDLVNGSGVVRGYATWEAKTGQKLFVIFGYTVPPYSAGKEFVPFEGTFQWIGGASGLQNVRGKGTIEGEISKRGETHYRWAGSYEAVTGK
jgi:hypothetical protein